ncbi:hypothetical protein E1B28_012437 [Marasmius oreades]|uniref:Uncharacterized protein n=1 Tax=Marasmius oreades TaxID=181124 RepID=A0A9P7UNY7_9AGAR|nr:uncharacterized protein E1B28_012437 [Marasmius oreades]KAG7088445.1 hypothetical protein E1B28_012437 [Marasmius oreades]
MGGNAFTSLPQEAFPRLPPELYRTLKAYFTILLQDLYTHVAVPREAPEKEDYGDIDFIVCAPKTDCSHKDIQEVLGAVHVIPLQGNKTSNFAIPITAQYGELMPVNGVVYCQVDINVCEDVKEWERICFFHSYGDMGMILGIVALNVGLAWGANGLKYPHPPHPPIILSKDHREILDFFGLSFDRWSSGFVTQEEVFRWVTSSRLFDPSRFSSAGQKVKPVRKMYHNFIQQVKGLDSALDSLPTSQMSLGLDNAINRRDEVRAEALVHFGKKSELEEFLQQVRTRETVKGIFNGHNVNEWTQLGGRWKSVKLVMDAVREKYGGERGLMDIIETEGEEGIKKRVLEASKVLETT